MVIIILGILFFLAFPEMIPIVLGIVAIGWLFIIALRYWYIAAIVILVYIVIKLFSKVNQFNFKFLTNSISFNLLASMLKPFKFLISPILYVLYSSSHFKYKVVNALDKFAQSNFKY